MNTAPGTLGANATKTPRVCGTSTEAAQVTNALGILRHGQVLELGRPGNSAGIILEQTILKLVGWDVGTEVEIHVTDDSLVLKRHLSSGRRSSDRPPEK